MNGSSVSDERIASGSLERAQKVEIGKEQGDLKCNYEGQAVNMFSFTDFEHSGGVE